MLKFVSTTQSRKSFPQHRDLTIWKVKISEVKSLGFHFPSDLIT